MVRTNHRIARAFRGLDLLTDERFVHFINASADDNISCSAVMMMKQQIDSGLSVREIFGRIDDTSRAVSHGFLLDVSSDKADFVINFGYSFMPRAAFGNKWRVQFTVSGTVADVEMLSFWRS